MATGTDLSFVVNVPTAVDLYDLSGEGSKFFITVNGRYGVGGEDFSCNMWPHTYSTYKIETIKRETAALRDSSFVYVSTVKDVSFDMSYVTGTLNACTKFNVNQGDKSVSCLPDTAVGTGISHELSDMIFYNLYDKVGGWYSKVKVKVKLLNPVIRYLVIGGGGGGGGNYRAGGGGAGAYRTNYNGEVQGGGTPCGPSKTVSINTALAIVVGAGGNGGQGNQGSFGGQSIFDDIISDGGGGGGTYFQDAPVNTGNGSGGGGGGKTNGSTTGAAGGTYGNVGGNGANLTNSEGQCGGGGAGAGTAGSKGGTGGTGGDGGSALSSSITGSIIARAGGGGAGAYSYGNNYPIGGGGGAGDGIYGDTPYRDGNHATDNTGSGGGGASGDTGASNGNGTGGRGGSGIVILRYLSGYNATFTSGVTVTTTVVGSDKVSVITRTSTSSETVTFS